MKRMVMLALALLIVSGVAFAQVQFSAGPKAGVDLGIWGGDDFNDDADDADGKGVGIGLAAGGFLEVAISEQFAVQPEVLFLQWKGKIKGDPDDVVTTANTVTIPVLAKGTFPVGPGGLFVLGGPAVALVVGDLTTDDGNSETDTEPDNSVLFGASLGAGYEQVVGPGTLSAELRFNRIFNQVIDDLDYYPQGISILLGYGFDF